MQHEEEIHQFWRQTITKAQREPLEAQVEQVNDPLPYEKYRITYRSLGGVQVRAYLSRPIGALAPGTRLPAIVTVPGYGVSQQGIMLDECQRGFVVLQIYPRSQGESAQFWKIDGPDKLTWHLEHPDGYYYQGAYADMVRGIDYLVSRPDVDPTRIGAMGTSQGGGMVLALASIDARVRALTAHLPFLCNTRLSATIEGSRIRTLLRQYNQLTPNSLNTLDYFDPLFLADRVTAPALVSAGGKDTTCPAVTIRSAFDRLAGIKVFAFYPDLTHTSCDDFYRLMWEWMERYLKQ
jgi:cephalosporin-C deacetylase